MRKRQNVRNKLDNHTHWWLYSLVLATEKPPEVICDETNNSKEDMKKGIFNVTIKIPLYLYIFRLGYNTND